MGGRLAVEWNDESKWMPVVLIRGSKSWVVGESS